MYRFGDFRLDPATRELHRGEERVVLPPKAFDCLLWLIEHRDRAVGRDELIAAVWGKVDVADNLLVQVVTRLRRMIDEDGRDSAIRTVPRFGYRWAVETELVDATVPALPKPHATSPPRRRRWIASLAAVAALALVAAVTVLALRERPAPAGAAPLALVLPVAVEAPPQHAWMRLGLMIALIERLRAAGQPVVPATNVVALAGGSVDALPGDALPAPLVIAARAQPDGERWRVALQTLKGRDPPLEAIGESVDALDAARLAADRLAHQLGLGPMPPDRTPADRSLAQRLLRAEAASLAGETDAAIALLDAADAAEQQSPEWRYQRAWADFVGGRLEPAQARLQRLLAELTDDDAASMRARAYNGLANVQYERGDLDGLRRSADAAIALLQDRDAPGEFGRALMSRGVAHAQGKDTDAAQRDFLQARVALESAGDRLGVARAELALGVVAKGRGRLVEALPALESAAVHLGAFDAAHDELIARTHLADAQLLLLEPAAALAGEPRLRELSGREHAPRARFLADLLRIEILAANGRLSAARELLRGLRVDDDRGVDGWRLGLARARHLLEPAQAEATEREMQAELSKLPPGEAGRDPGRSALIVLRGALARGHAEEARAAALAIQAWAARNGDADVRLYTDLAEAEQHAAADRVELARRAFESAQRRAAAAQVPGDMLWVAQAHAGWLIRNGDLAGASAAAGGVAGWARRDYDAALLQLQLQHALGAYAPWQAALERARLLAGERRIPAELERAPPQRDADVRSRIAASAGTPPSP
ncbi:winged helix-turn-helix domain-containing protein [Dokdonella sp.]|uniref:winged helix-turn-helix domain-containing protein n=1 Tax=Dokdonella sp. TaxID=2291710 RepID=UPI001B04E850|nr:winged helix-turn-helix domain-containing protein [Dokdonella sp.]MBO9662133.1 winged helix-turn-helix domain-containing protein [Dokdonella sp.]